jgi:hypothetical protein
MLRPPPASASIDRFGHRSAPTARAAAAARPSREIAFTPSD